MTKEYSLDDMLSDDQVTDQPEEVEPDEPEADVAEVQEPEEAEQPEPEQAEAEPEEQEQKHVPLAALQEARGENRTLKERLAHIEKMIAQNATPNQPAPKVPDIYAEPEAYQGYIQQQLSMVQANTIAEMSERFARTQHGEDVVNEAFETAKSQGLIDRFRGSRDPWGDLVKWHKTQKVAAEIGDDPEQWRAKEREKLKREIQAELTAQSVRPTARPSPSLAGQPNLGTRGGPEWGGPTPLDDILGGA